MTDLDSTMLGGQPLPPRPPQWSRAKLTNAQREQIRHRYADGETKAVLAAEFGVHTGTIGAYVEPRRGR